MVPASLVFQLGNLLVVSPVPFGLADVERNPGSTDHTAQRAGGVGTAGEAEQVNLVAFVVVESQESKPALHVGLEASSECTADEAVDRPATAHT